MIPRASPRGKVLPSTLTAGGPLAATVKSDLHHGPSFLITPVSNMPRPDLTAHPVAESGQHSHAKQPAMISCLRSQHAVVSPGTHLARVLCGCHSDCRLHLLITKCPIVMKRAKLPQSRRGLWLSALARVVQIQL